MTRSTAINVINVGCLRESGCVRLAILEIMSRDQPDGDLINVLNKVLPFEKHLPGMRYCGPGTNLGNRLHPDGTPKPGNEPIDRIDEAAMRHDIQYCLYNDRRHRLEADKVMIKELLAIKKPTCRERLERMVVLPFLFIKRIMSACLLKIPIINNFT
jgi:Phospholipase A2-like domain